MWSGNRAFALGLLCLCGCLGLDQLELVSMWPSRVDSTRLRAPGKLLQVQRQSPLFVGTSACLVGGLTLLVGVFLQNVGQVISAEMCGALGCIC